MEDSVSTKTPDQVAITADEAYAHPDDEGGEIVDVTVSPTLSTVISVRLNSSDLAEIEAAAAGAGQKISSYLRGCALAAARQSDAISADVATRMLAAIEAATADARNALDAAFAVSRKRVEAELADAVGVAEQASASVSVSPSSGRFRRTSAISRNTIAKASKSKSVLSQQAGKKKSAESPRRARKQA